MKLAIIGSRDFIDYEYMRKTLKEKLPRTPITLIISGGARGADSLAERYAKENNIPLKVYWADLVKYGRSAGYRRNIDIVKEVDFVIAFWDGKSKGTKHSIDLCYQYNKQLIIEIVKI